MQNEIRLFKIFGIEINISYSWFFIFFLITFVLIFLVFPFEFPQFTQGQNIVLGLITSIIFFASLLAHEVMHSVVAKRNGLDVKQITLFIFGGVSKLSDEPDNPALEFKMAAAGPGTSLFLALIFWAVTRVSELLAVPQLFSAPFVWLWQINLALAIFNLIPGFPLDGGRLLRAGLWAITKNVTKATRIASRAGQGFAIFLMFFGGLSFLAGQPFGLWLILIGWFLNQAAVSSFNQLVARETLKDIKVGSVMTTNLVAVGPGITLEDLMENYLLRYGFRRLPVIEDSTLIGVVRLIDLGDIPRNQWPSVRIKEVTKPPKKEALISPGESALEALKRMSEFDLGQLIVVSDGNHIEGLVTRRDLIRAIEIRQHFK